MGVDENFVDFCGCRVLLRRTGTGHPVLFLHGAGGVPQWVPFFDRLAEAQASIGETSKCRRISGPIRQVLPFCADVSVHWILSDLSTSIGDLDPSRHRILAAGFERAATGDASARRAGGYEERPHLLHCGTEVRGESEPPARLCLRVALFPQEDDGSCPQLRR